MRPLLASLFAFALLGIVVPSVASALEVGDAAPPIPGTEWFNWEPLSLSEAEGRLFLLFVFEAVDGTETGDAVMINAVNAMQSRWSRWRSQEAIRLVGLSTSPSAETEDFLEHHGIEFPTVVASAAAETYGAEALPYYILVDGGGMVASASDNEGATMRAVDGAIRDWEPPVQHPRFEDDYPRQLRRAVRDLNRARYDVLDDLQELADDAEEDETVRATAREMIEAVTTYAEELWTAFEELDEQDLHYEAREKLAAFAGLFGDVEAYEERIEEAVDRYEGRELREPLYIGQQYHAARQALWEGDQNAATEGLERVWHQFPDSPYARMAERLVQRIPGYRPSDD